MRQLVQSVRSGDLRIVDAPDPVIGASQVLVATSHSVVSAGTERAVRQLASASLLQKARARPDLVRQVIRKARTEGIRSTVNAVQTRLDDDMPLGYSAAGVVVAVGDAVSWVRPGMRVATGGAGHGDLQVVAGNLAVPIPDQVDSGDAAFATVAAIALHGLRLADVGPGGKVCVIGLGLIGQMTARLALAAGLEVVGIDLRAWAADRASAAGTLGLVEQGADTTSVVMEWSRGRGADAVLLTAATPSSEPMRRAAAVARDRATLVVVGDVGMELERTPLYEKELTVKVARSYGPGRYERAYEEWAIDYPAGHVRWSEGRNLEAVLDLLASGKLALGDLVTHRFAFEEAPQAYAVLAQPSAQYLGIQLTYAEQRIRHIVRRPVATAGAAVRGIGLIGAGNFARGVLVPAVKEAELGTVRAVSSAGGTSASKLAAQLGAVALTTEELLADDAIGLVMIATSHDTHAALVIQALGAGKHVYCEKPLALTEDELDAVTDAWERSGNQLAVGFNRRHSPWVAKARSVLASAAGPLVITYRVNAGSLPAKHWYHDRTQGGRLVGEVCHFIDTCTAIVGKPVLGVAALSSGRAEAVLDEDLVVSLSYADGSVAAITYATGGHSSTAKERIEILGRDHSIVIDDFRSITIDDKTDSGAQDKGHVEQLRALKAALTGNDHHRTEVALRSMADTLHAARALGGR